MTEEKKNRHFLLTGNISESSVESVIKDIREINRHDDEQEKKVVDYEREPITILVSSFGGSAYCGFGLVHEIIHSKTPVHTECNSKAMSMGLPIFLAGKQRKLGEFATLMYHSVSFGIFSDIVEIERELGESNRLQEMYDKVILKYSNVLESQLQEYKDQRKNWYITADVARKLGMADEVVGG
jgi:ATP-dependent protease ClpP protease subunit